MNGALHTQVEKAFHLGVGALFEFGLAVKPCKDPVLQSKCSGVQLVVIYMHMDVAVPLAGRKTSFTGGERMSGHFGSQWIPGEQGLGPQNNLGYHVVIPLSERKRESNGCQLPGFTRSPRISPNCIGSTDLNARGGQDQAPTHPHTSC